MVSHGWLLASWAALQRLGGEASLGLWRAPGWVLLSSCLGCGLLGLLFLCCGGVRSTLGFLQMLPLSDALFLFSPLK